jgi:adenylate cyclase
MVGENEKIYEFAEFRLIPGEGLLLNSGTPVNLNPKTFAVLTLLVERHGHLVTKSEIINNIWEEAFVEEGAISKAICFIRNALGDTSKERFIHTVPRRGYRFVAPVRVLNDPANGTGKSEHSSTGYRLPVPSQGDGLDTEFDFEDRTAETSGANKTFSAAEMAATAIGNNGTTGDIPSLERAVEAAEAPERHRSRFITSAYFKLAAIIATISLIAILLGYYGFVRSSSRSPRSIVVLPVAPIGAANRDEICEFGIADSLINHLAASEGFRVKRLNAVRDYAGKNVDPIAVGNEQKVDYVLELSYQIADGKIKVTGPLYNVASGSVEDTFRNEQDATQIFKAQDAIATIFGNQLMTHFGARTGPPLAKRGTENQEAYRLYLQAMLLIDKRRSENSKKAREYLEQAVAVDPNYAQAWAAVALAVRHSDRSDAEHIHQEITEAANRALAIDPSVSDAYTALCYDKLHYDYDFAGAEFNCKQAIQVDQNSSTAHRAYCWLLRYSGRYDEALAEIETAIDLEPVSYVNQRDYGYALYRAGRFDEAAAQWERLVDLDPADQVPYNQLVRTLQAQGNEADALRWFIKLLTLRQVSPETIQQYTNIYQTSGWRGVSLERAKDSRNAPGGGSDFGTATLYAYAGEKDKAFEHLEKSFQRREWNFAGLWESPELEPLRDDPRYKDLLTRIKGN